MNGGHILPLPDALRTVPMSVLEEYVIGRIKQFSNVFAHVLSPESSGRAVEAAFAQAVSLVSEVNDTLKLEKYSLRFAHKCRFLGCMDKSCALCANNPNKRCLDHDNFDECYADNQALKSKCDIDVYVQLFSLTTGNVVNLPGLEIQVSVVDGESCSHGGAGRSDNAKELLKSDDGQFLLGSMSSVTKTDGTGRLLLKLQDGACRLPDIFITDKNDTFHMDSRTYSSFRILARAVQRDMAGNVQLVDSITPAVSGKLIVKTQRALNDYRKSEYPHYKDELTKLKFIGQITAQRLKDIQAHVPDAPFMTIETVHQLKDLMLCADQSRQLENKLLELLNMRGRHKHKWDFLREILMERIVYDDMLHRAWFADEAQTQGVLYTCKQGQVNMEKPLGLVYRVNQGDGQTRLQVVSAQDGQNIELVKEWRVLGEEAWFKPGHKGWTIVNEPLELAANGSMISPRPSMSDGLDSFSSAKRESIKRESIISSQHSADLMNLESGQLGRALSLQQSFSEHQRQPLTFPFQAMEQQQQQQIMIRNPFQSLPRLGPPAAGSGNSSGSSASGVGASSPTIYQFGSLPQTNSSRLANVSSKNQPMAAGIFDLYTRVSAPQFSTPDSSPTSHPHMVPSSGASAPSLTFFQAGNSFPRVNDGSTGEKPMRYRRMSAEAGARQASPPHAGLGAGSPFNITLDLSTKRPRAPAPLLAVGRNNERQDPVFGGGQPSLNHLPIRRLSDQQLYHQESSGRHQPKSRVSSDIAEDGGAHADGGIVEDSIDEFLAQNMPNLGPVSFASDSFHRDSFGRSFVAPAPTETPTHKLSNTMEHMLHVSHQGSEDGHLTAPMSPRVFQTMESDSFNKTISRILRHSESDSFKQLLEASGLNSPH
ncbi:hypothetical protein CEUSTIGMA_g3513.t1 [Chlamydomonas eustigma]|uniref:Uncharacterized protein n=1 Tax=Chlamydomonas eustigma TaxID=1157962 RepID=A0A250WZY6_9CHLO|nr:hypothetical protein CEUSTIGMA_g3513.t1 [Chlamydomonas eustigma]|eukprot:GAX76070.1 hypothetical protein CEUSTIGMA_g3513.t1 [Chlamydomonas eustigma]